jgi:serine/threonine-protein kinase
VYAALDALVERSVALTRLALDPGDPAAMQQVLRQARTWTGFSHLNVGSLFDVFEHGGAVYVAAELVEGKTLAAALTSAVPLHPASVLEWMAQLAGALDSIHKAGLLHGNVTPSSIVIEPLPRLWEFDVACVPTGTGRVRAGGDASPYWSPEQRAGNALDRRADLFSFALCVYQALSGAPELPPVAVASIGQRLREGDAALPDLEALGVAREGWRDVFATALAADPAERYASGAA